MLVLTRKVGEEIQIGPNIIVRVMRQQGNRIQLGIIAPKEVSIQRTDLKPLGESNAGTASETLADPLPETRTISLS